MPVPATSTSWGEEVEDKPRAVETTTERTSAAPAAASAATKMEALPAREETRDGNTRKVVDYYHNDEGKVVRRVRVYRTEKRKIASTKAEQERRNWVRFGLAASSKDDQTTTVAEEVYLRLSSQKEVASKPKDENEELRQRLVGKTVRCRHCGGDHYSHKCPRKELMVNLDAAVGPAETPEEREGEPTKAGAGDASQPGGAPGRYVAPARRNASGRGESMFERDDSCTMVITNLAEDTTDDDLKDLCRHFGATSRVFLAKDRQTGYAKGFAFVTFQRREDTRNAIEQLEGHPFNNVILHADWAQPSARN